MQVLIIVGVACILVVDRKRVNHLKLNIVDTSFLFFISATLLSWLPALGLQWDGLRMSGIWTAVAYLLFRSGASEALGDKRFRRILLGSAFLVGCYASAQHFFGMDLAALSGESRIYSAVASPEYFSVIGFFNRHHSFAISAVVCCTLIYGLYRLQGISFAEKLLAAIALSPLLLAILFAQSRAAYVALVAVLIFWLILAQLHRWKLALILSIALLSVIAIALDPGVGLRILDIPGAQGETSRLDIAKVSLQMFSDRPLVGWGSGRFFIQSQVIFDRIAPMVDIRSGTHNELISGWTGGGLLLGFAHVFLAVALGRTVLSFFGKSEIGMGLIAASGLLVFYIAGMWHNILADGELSLPFWMLAGLIGREASRGDCSWKWPMKVPVLEIAHEDRRIDKEQQITDKP